MTRNSCTTSSWISQARTDRGLPSRSRPAQEGQGNGHIKLDRAYIGSCTGGKTSDFLAFARVVRGKKREDRHVRRARHAEDRPGVADHLLGRRNRLEILVNAGVQMTENAGCAACLGGPVDTFGRINKPA